VRNTWTICRLDLGQNLRRPLFWIWIILLVFMTWGLSTGNVRIGTGDSTVGGTKAWITSEFAVAQLMLVLVAFLYSFFIAVGAGMSVIRDDELNVGDLIHSTPLSPREYVWGKFWGAFLAFLFVLGLHVLLSMFFNHVTTGAEEAEYVGPLVLENYLRPTVLLALPTLLFLAGTAFAVGSITRKPILVFVLPVAMLMLCGFFLWSWSPSWLDPRINRALMLVDPTGYRWLNETWLKVDRGVEFYNTAHVSMDLGFILNRIGVSLIGLMAVFWSVRSFEKRLRGSRDVGEKKRTDTPADPTKAGLSPRRTPTEVRVRKPGLLRGALAMARADLRELFGQPGLYLFIPLIVLEAIGNATLQTGPFDTPMLVTSGTVAVGTLGLITTLGLLLVMFYLVESLRRDEGARLAPISYATPVRTASMLLGKYFANGLVVAVVLAVTFLACAIVMLVQGTVPLESRPFLLIWGVLLVPTFVLWAAFTTAVYAVTRSRYTTYGVCLAVFGYTAYKAIVGEMNWVGNWPLWGAVQWSDMGAFELNGKALLLNRLFALGLALFFVVFALRITPRREYDGTRILGRLRPRALLRTALVLLPWALLPITSGVMLAHEVDAGYQGDQADKAAKDYWRRNTATWTDARDPDIAHVEIDLQLDPARRWFHVSGSYELVNREWEPFREIALTRNRGWDDIAWTLDGEAHEPDDRVGLVVFSLEPPLELGESVTIGFTFEGVHPQGVSENGGGAGTFILPSGVVLTSFSPNFLPVVGYMEGIGIDEDNSYDAKEYADDYYEGVTRSAFGTGAPYSTRIRITGPEAYTLNSVGTLISEEIVDGQRTALWESDYPVRFFNVVAGRWDVARGVGTAIYHHPAHTYNVEEMLEALDAARHYYSKWFYPYPWQELKLSEFPAMAGYAQGFPTNITFSEAIGFLTKSEPKSNAPFLVTAHESAHQWWGNILTPGSGPGGNILSEGMAHFSTILLQGAAKGEHERIEFCKRIEERYGDGRQVDSERPLVKIDGTRPGDNTVTYDKGGWVFWMLHRLMGEERSFAGLQSFIRAYEGNRDHPVLQDFVEHMRGHAADRDAYDAFVDQWFFDVVIPEYQLEDVTYEAGVVRGILRNVGSGRMKVEVAAERGTRFPDPDESGAEAGSESEQDAETYATVSFSLELGAGEEREFTLRCDFEPERVLVDPDALVLQLGRERAIHRF
jgi:ABC-2 type transport system permease protein